LNPTTFHTDAQTVTLAIIAVVLPFAAFVVDKKIWAKGLLVFVSLVLTAHCSAQDKELPKAKRSYKVDTIYKHKVNYPANKGLATATTGMNDTAAAQAVKDTAKTVYRTAPHKTFVLVNGQFYGGDIHNLNADDILNTNIFKSASAESLYGSLNGGYPSFSIDTKQKISSDTTRIDSVATQGPLYIIDGKPIDGKPKDVFAEDIIEIIAIKKIFGPNVYPNKPDNGAIIITTRTFAITQYQKKLSSFSKEYQACLNSSKADDSRFIYILNNRQLSGRRDEVINVLYAIPKNSIRKVTFLKPSMKSVYALNFPAVVIKTKKK
jgi:hypothetical protein